MIISFMISRCNRTFSYEIFRMITSETAILIVKYCRSMKRNSFHVFNLKIYFCIGKVSNGALVQLVLRNLRILPRHFKLLLIMGVTFVNFCCQMHCDWCFCKYQHICISTYFLHFRSVTSCHWLCYRCDQVGHWDKLFFPFAWYM